MASPPRLPKPAVTEPAALDESAWLDVIHKMDEVYSQLVADEVALEEKNLQLEQSQQFIFGLLTAMSDVLVAVRADGTIEETNPALCQLAGRGEAELRGTPLAALLADDEQRRRLRETLHALRPQRAVANVELELLDVQGQRVPVDFNCSLRRNAKGKPIGHVLVGRPLAELKRAYHALHEAHEALKRTQAQLVHSEKMASLGRLVAGVAHELNNPISFVAGNVRALQRYGSRLQRYLAALHGGATPGAVQALRHELRIDALLGDLPSLIEGMQEGAQRTADIVAGLKRFSAMDREAMRPVDLAEVVGRAADWVRRGNAPGFEVRLHVDGECTVQGHPGQLMQVVMNLVQNAFDASSDRPRPAMDVHLARVGDVVCTRFVDDGSGVDEADLSRIFDPFFTTKPPGQGTGLGLSISYGIVERHGGSLHAERNAGRGMTFVLALPAIVGQRGSPRS